MKKNNMSIRGLVPVIGRSRNTIKRYLAMPGAPIPDDKGRFNPDEVSAFIKSQGGDFYADRGPARMIQRDGDPDPMDWTPAGVHIRMAAWLHSRLPRAAAGKTENEISKLLSKYLVEFDELREAGRLPSWESLFARRQGEPITGEDVSGQ